MIFKLRQWVIILLVGFVSQSKSNAEQKLTLEWVDQLSSHSKIRDLSQGVAIDSLGSVFISGWTSGKLGDANYGSSDAFVSKYDSSGNLAWTQQLGTSASDESFAVSADHSGNVYISGNTGGNLSGLHPDGSADVFLSKYGDNGTLLWARQFGSSQYDRGEDLTTNNFGNTYIAGYTLGSIDGVKQPVSDIDNDAFVSKYASDGTHLWTRQFGTDKTDRGFGVSVDGTENVYVAGYTFGNLGGNNSGRTDAFVIKLNSEGVEQWTHQLGTSQDDYGNDLAVDKFGNVYVTGYTEGKLVGDSAGNDDVFLSKIDSAGELLWTRQFGAIGDDRGEALFLDDLGDIYVTGRIESEVRQRGSDQGDGFVSKYDSNGNLLWMDSFGTKAFDTSQGIAVDGSGKIYVSGYTQGSFEKGYLNNAPWSDAFVAKFSQPIPESSTLFLCLSGFLLLLSSRRNSSGS